MFFNSNDISRLVSNSQDEGVDISKLIKNKIEITDPLTIVESQEDIIALADFCKKHGIIMAGLGNFPASKILEILKKRVGSLE